jgi:hypothetical protein
MGASGRHFDAMPGRVERGASGNSSKVAFAASREIEPSCGTGDCDTPHFQRSVLQNTDGEIVLTAAQCGLKQEKADALARWFLFLCHVTRRNGHSIV